MLRKPSYWECLMIKNPLVPLVPNHRTQILFAVIFWIVYISIWLVLFPNLPTWYYALSSATIAIKVFWPFIMASKADPGYLKSDPDIDFLELL